MTELKIATRNSPLALWQAEHVKQKLCELNHNLTVTLVGISTKGDRFLDVSLGKIGGKGLFIKELEQAIFNGEADIAVHSMKDVTIDLPKGMILPVIMQREDSRDVFISNHYQDIGELPEGGILGTSSLRRHAQIMALRSDIVIKELRGNVGTRLSKLDNHEYDAIILAAAGVKRLGLSERVKQFIPCSQILPAVGQGAIGIECRDNDNKVLEIVMPLNDEKTSVCVQAERSFNRRLGGGCHLPIAGHASLFTNNISLTGMVAHLDGSKMIKEQFKGAVTEKDIIGINLAESLLEHGAEDILNKYIS